MYKQCIRNHFVSGVFKVAFCSNLISYVRAGVLINYFMATRFVYKILNFSSSSLLDVFITCLHKLRMSVDTGVCIARQKQNVQLFEQSFKTIIKLHRAVCQRSLTVITNKIYSYFGPDLQSTDSAHSYKYIGLE